jgi:cation diffusion facilitator family transporter
MQEKSHPDSATDPHSHSHEFAKVDPKNEGRTLTVVALTAVTMVVEIAAGSYYGSMALLADGWHMGTHVLALAIAVFAYRIARRHAANARFTFGTGKVGVLGGFASATTLAIVALLMVVESLHRLFAHSPIQFNQAILVAVVGLIVNLVSALILERAHQPHHPHAAGAAHAHAHGPDLNMRAAYIHVVADALTSVLAIFALLAGKYAGLVWMDPLMGLLGAALIGRWSFGLLRETGAILLDAAVDPQGVAAIRQALGPDIHISDLHVWKVGADADAAIVSIVTDDPKPVAEYKKKLAGIPRLTHITVEVLPVLPRKKQND